MPDESTKNRIKQEATQVLTSGRTVSETFDLYAEMVDALADLWKNEKFVRLPAPLKRNLLSTIQQTSQHANQYGTGQIAAQDFENRVDGLHTFLWQNNLIDRTEKLPGFEKKNERLEFLKRKGRRIIRELEKGIPKRDEVNSAADQVAQLKERAAKQRQGIEAASQTADEHVAKSTNTVATIEERAAEAQRRESEAKAAEQRARESANETAALQAKIEKFFETIEANQAKLENTIKKADNAVNTNTQKTNGLVQRNEELEKQVLDQLQKATGASLFSAFDERKKVVSIARWIWAGISVTSLVFAVFWGVYVAQSTNAVDALFYVKLAATVPLLALVVFALSQYGRERRAEEEYAFKSALSLSLVPYKELIEATEKDGHSQEYVSFLVRTIGQIYQSPRLATEDEENADIVSLRAIGEITKLIELKRS